MASASHSIALSELEINTASRALRALVDGLPLSGEDRVRVLGAAARLATTYRAHAVACADHDFGLAEEQLGRPIVLSPEAA